MTETRNPGTKIGVLLINKRLEVPSSYPDRESLQQITFAPEVQEILQEGDYWRISGLLNICITYRRAKPALPANQTIEAEMGQLSGFLEEKTFFDDGFSDHDEFAEEGAKLVEDDWEEGNPRQDSISYLQPLEFTGITPRKADFVPSGKPRVSLIDLETKTPGEHMVDIRVILAFEDEAVPQVTEQAWGEGVEFIQPFALTSWPPGMAEVVEWQVGYPEWQVMLKDKDAVVSGNLIVQVIGAEKEGQEREFTGISTQCPMQIIIPLDQSRPNSTVSGVKVEILEVREDPAGLAVRGLVLIDRIPEISAVETEFFQDDILLEGAESVENDDNLDKTEFNQNDGNLEEIERIEEDVHPDEAERIQEEVHSEEPEIKLEATYSGDVDPDAHEILCHVDQLADELADFEEVLSLPPEEEVEVTQSAIGEASEPSEFEAETTSQETPTAPAPGKVKFKLSYSNQGSTQKSPQARHQEPPSQVEAEPQQPVPGILKKIARGKGRTNWKLYLVKQQDTLESICENYGISQEDFRAKNKLDANVEPGQYLWITS